MESAEKFIERIESRNTHLGKIGNFSFGLFDGPKQYVHTYNLYLHIFNTIPNRITMHHSKMHNIINRIERDFSNKIIDKHYLRYSMPSVKTYKYSQIIYIMENQVMIDIELTGEMGILFSEANKDDAFFYEKIFRQRYAKQKESRIHMVKSGHFGLDLTPLNVKKPVLNLTLNYNDDFLPIHKLLIGNLRKKNKAGLVLLHGRPGTGKSTYIKYLINSLRKKVIFLPPSLASTLESPDLTSLLTENPNSVFIIEDAEQLIKSRESSGESRISLLLNLTDGILGEALGSVFICTFNTDLRNIDEALLRKGRLIASYEFDELPIAKLIKLKEHFGLADFQIKDRMVLSDVYHIMENRFDEEKRTRKAIGFNSNTTSIPELLI